MCPTSLPQAARPKKCSMHTLCDPVENENVVLAQKEKGVSRSKQEAQVGLESPAGPASEGLTSGHWCPALASAQDSDVLSSLKNAQVA